MTIAHEIGHYFTLCFCGFSLQRNFKRQKVKPFNDPNGRQNVLLGVYDAHHLTGDMSVQKSLKPAVFLDAADYQHNHRN
jgi:hypothetical protein